ncbi:ATP-binding protein [Streptomyces sp. MI02-2A]|nr:ATP-binding protein [Streptomyces sp. MI02-2A]
MICRCGGHRSRPCRRDRWCEPLVGVATLAQILITLRRASASPSRQHRASRPAGNACVSSAPHLVFKTGGALNEGYFTAARREWGQAFGDEVLAPAILDRLLHHCEVVRSTATATGSRTASGHRSGQRHGLSRGARNCELGAALKRVRPKPPASG